jgi:hypothetical protein
MPATRYPLLTTLLRRYFYSGWAFLIPYLAAYLLYYVTAWPVNPSLATAEAAASSALTPLTPDASYHLIPSLLHLYWALHGIHLILAAIALRSWWTENSAQSARVARNADSAPYYSYGLHLLTRIAPWAILALLFYIPGVYLEWPSDPWEHLRRINEWRILDTVGAHSSWHKSFYFIPYSFLSWCIGLRQLFWLDFYYTGICLLLCWQYYRFSRACGLGERASMVFVIIQALLFGNNIFSFYRYYGISSSIYAQLGAIALTRIVLEFAARGTNLAPKHSGTGSQRRSNSDSEVTEAAGSSNVERSSPSAATPFSFSCLKPDLLPLITAVTCLTALMAFNHIQGVGIAGLGIAAIIIWRLIEWKRSTLWWLIGGTLILNAAFLWLYPRPEIIETYRAEGWLNAWYGFNFVRLSSVATDRGLQILSFTGLGGIAAAVVLIGRRSVVAWSTLLPLIAFASPVVAIPFALIIANYSDASNIITFQRMLLAISPAMSMVLVCAPHLISKPSKSNHMHSRGTTVPFPAISLYIAALTLIATLVILMVAPPGIGSYNRVWHSLTAPPKDLTLVPELNQQNIIFTQSAPPIKLSTLGNKADASAYVHTMSPIAAGTNRIIGGNIVNSFSSAIEAVGLTGQTTTHQSDLEANTITATSDVASASNLDDWTSLIGSEPVVAQSTLGDADVPVLQNKPGDDIFAFSRKLIRIDESKNYLLSISIRQPTSTNATAYLAVAWYDNKGLLLPAHAPQPEGAGAPNGWNNGTYSYFGITGQQVPSRWTTYTISFGIADVASIPSNAVYFRVGALLNYTKRGSSVIQIARVNLQRRPRGEILLLLTKERGYSPYSQAGTLSRHWPSTQVSIDRSGTSELLTAYHNIPPP